MAAEGRGCGWGWGVEVQVAWSRVGMGVVVFCGRAQRAARARAELTFGPPETGPGCSRAANLGTSQNCRRPNSVKLRAGEAEACLMCRDACGWWGSSDQGRRCNSARPLCFASGPRDWRLL